jgi:hypothetical protein
MNQCPFCDESFPTENELNGHILKVHPEKTASAEAFALAMQKIQRMHQLQSLAANLTGVSFGANGAEPEAVLERFKYFLRQLMEGFPKE